MALAKEVVNQTGAIREFEKPEVCEAIKVANANRWTIYLTPTEWDEREARLKKEYEENTKAPGSAENRIKGDLSGNKSIEHCGELIPGPIFISAEGINFNRKYNQNTSENPALAESASQFNDSLLDEQADKIKRLGKEITRLNKAIHKKNMKIEELRKESSRHLRGKIKVFYENVDLEKMLKDKNAVLSDVAEELRLSKIREKNLTEVGQKYMKENEELNKKLSNKIVDKIDAQALKSAESAIAYKEKVIADLGKELKATKTELEEKTKLVETVRKRSKEYREFGVEAVKMIRKMAKVIVNEGTVSSEDFKEYRRLANGGIFMQEISEKELMKLQEKFYADILADDTFEKWLLFGKIIIKSEK